MPENKQVRKHNEFSRYREILTRLSGPALRDALAKAGGTPGLPGGSILRGLPAALLMLSEDKELHVGLAEGLHQLAAIGKAVGESDRIPTVRDTLGQTRKVYHPLILHLHLAAFLRRYETMPAPLWSACEDALPDAVLPARQVEAYADKAPPLELTAVALWQALCILDQARLTSRDVDAELIDTVVHAITNRSGPEGSLHPRGADEALDAWTYRELSGLHALGGLALARRNAAWSLRVEEIAVYHMANTQPDHTTTQPWGVFAFLWSPKTRPFAEQQMHDATAFGATGGDGLGALAAMLLADAADALATFEE